MPGKTCLQSENGLALLLKERGRG